MLTERVLDRKKKQEYFPQSFRLTYLAGTVAHASVNISAAGHVAGARFAVRVAAVPWRAPVAAPPRVPVIADAVSSALKPRGIG